MSLWLWLVLRFSRSQLHYILKSKEVECALQSVQKIRALCPLLSYKRIMDSSNLNCYIFGVKDEICVLMSCLDSGNFAAIEVVFVPNIRPIVHVPIPAIMRLDVYVLFAFVVLKVQI